MNKYTSAALLTVGLLLVSCKESSSSDENALAAALLEPEAPVTTTTTIDATNAATWTYLRLQDGSFVTSSDNWDLAFKRYKIATNSGVSGSGSGGACDTLKTDFASVGPADTGCTFTLDTSLLFPVPIAPPCPAGQTEQDGACYLPDKANAAVQDWYAYDGSTHLITSNRSVYVIRGSNGNTYYKLQLLDYYTGGASGMITVRFDRLD